MISNPYGIQRRRKGRSSDIDDPAFRTLVVSHAATGLSRRGVAAMVGKTESTIRGWIERGMAFPEVEPWGSFSDAYRRAERGIEAAAKHTAALKVQLMKEQMEAYWAWRTERGDRPVKPLEPRKVGKKAPAEDQDRYREEYDAWAVAFARYETQLEAWEKPPAIPDVAELAWLDRFIEGRFPEDHGATKHRKPETEYDGQRWLDNNTMDREQLAALFSDPPEPIRQGLQDSAAHVYRILLAGGFDPAVVTRKAEDGSEEVSGAGGDESRGAAAGHGSGEESAG